MRLVVSTIVRSAPRGRDGYVYVVEWDRKEVVKRFQPPPAVSVELGPRGSTRGYRGITFVDNHCLIANSDSIFFYDTDWQLTKTITHPWFSDIHEIEADGDGIWVVSTGLDAVLKCDFDGRIVEEYFLGELPADTRIRLGIRERVIDRELDHRHIVHPVPTHSTHVNSVCVRNGRPYVTLANQGAVVGLKPMEVLCQNLGFYGAHSARLVDEKTLYMAQSYARSFAVLELPSGKVRVTVRVLPRDRDPRGWFGATLLGVLTSPLLLQSPVAKHLLKRFSGLLRKLAQSAPPWMSPTQGALPGWARGLAIVGSDKALVGSSPAGVSLINVTARRLEHYLQLDGDLANSVSDIAVDPR